MLKKYPHNPAHLYLDNQAYFITAAIYHKRPLLAEPAIKDRLLELLQGYFGRHDWELHHWVILDNHYHVLGKSHRGKDMERIFWGVHSRMALRITKFAVCEKPIWWNYWDYCPRDESDYITRLNYLLNNPVKHGYVLNLHDYPFSSFHHLFDRIGRVELVKQFQAHPDYQTLILHEAKEDDF